MLGVLLCVAGGGALALASYSSGRAEAVEAGLVALFGSLLMLLAWFDLSSRTIPNTIVYPAIMLAILLAPTWPDRSVVQSLEGGAAALFVMSVAWTLARGGLGGGDVKLATFVGATVGHPAVLTAGAATVLTGGGIAAGLLLARMVERRSSFAYGPFIAVGGLVGLLA